MGKTGKLTVLGIVIVLTSVIIGIVRGIFLRDYEERHSLLISLIVGGIYGALTVLFVRFVFNKENRG